MKRLFSFLLGISILQSVLYAQSVSFNNIKHSENVLTTTVDSLTLDSVFTAFRNSNSVPGIAALIFKDNQVIWTNNYGYRNLELQLPVTDSTIFLIASISKTIIATAVMQLWEKGLIQLDSSINNYLPDSIRVKNPYYPEKTITVRMLMTHTSSIQDNWNYLDTLLSCGDYPVSLGQFLQNYFTPGGTFYNIDNFYRYYPGTMYNYTSAGASLLALAVEHIAGKSFNDYTRDSIFTPLSMNKTSWFLSETDTNNIAVPYQSGPLCQPGYAYWPTVQLKTNKLELANFLSAYANRGVYKGKRILKKETVQMMLSDQVGYSIFEAGNGRQGLIWRTFSDIYDSAWGHGGDVPGVSTLMLCNESENWGTIFFANLNWQYFDINEVQVLLSLMCEYAHSWTNIKTGIEGEKFQQLSFRLEQNYPNPFNPTTSIEYRVASTEYVTLKVYDVLGRQEATLVNEEKQPGTYEVNFDASNFSSGIYFYKIQAGNFTESKKMILLK